MSAVIASGMFIGACAGLFVVTIVLAIVEKSRR